MNVTELARRVKILPNELLDILPVFGFDIGRRAIKVDDRTAWKIIESWPRIRRDWQKMQEKAAKQKGEEIAADEAPKEKPGVSLPQVLTVRELASRLGLPLSRVMAELVKNGILAAANERIDFTTASIIAQDLDFAVIEEDQKSASAAEVVSDVIHERLSRETDTALKPRPPVVVVMGHVDHGKTKLLDTIRKTNVVEGEAGGITQHIGAYQTAHNDRVITFIDTPGHEAFTTMRSRGARVADVAILTVAADDGVQPQTIEALSIIKAAGLPFVVAINKMDKPDATADKVKRELSEKGVISEDWGGKIPFVPVSAKTGTGIDALLGIILLLADIEQGRIRANPEANAIGTVVESHVSGGEGPVATILVQNGTLKVGDVLAAGDALYGRVRAMKDWAGKTVKEAPPGMPIKILGFKTAPEVGDIIEVPKTGVKLKLKKAAPEYTKRASPRPAGAREEAREDQMLVNIIIKADTLGSLEAIADKLEQLQVPEVATNIVVKGLGNITEAEILQAESAGAIIYGFNVAAPFAVEDLAREKGVEIKIYRIIYELLDDIKERLRLLLKPEIIRTDFGRLKILSVFRKEKQYVIIGGRVEEGRAVKGAKVTIMREDNMEGEGEIAELQSGKQTAAEIPGGSECGLKVKTKNAIMEGDVLIMYKEETRERKLTI